MRGAAVSRNQTDPRPPRTGRRPFPTVEPLAPGAQLPPLAAEGWINGPPPSPSRPGVRLFLLDVWADWCPYCRSGAPELTRLYEKFAGRGVAFVSLTDMPRQTAAAFVEQFAVLWPNGYGISAEAVVALGAKSGLQTPEYKVAPIVYLVGPDGRIRWTDRRARYRHTEAEPWGRELDAAIEAALASPDGTR